MNTVQPLKNSISRLYESWLIGTLLLLCCTMPAMAAAPNVQHIIIITQENRTPDNLFHGLAALVPAADIASSGVTSTGQTVPLVPILFTAPFDMSHAFVQFRTQYQNGQMNGNDQVTCVPGNGATSCPANPGYSYIDPSQNAPYVTMAAQYGFANRMFQSSRGPSLPAHLMLLTGSGQPFANSNLDIANNYTSLGPDTLSGISGCAAPASQTAQMIGSAGTVVSNIPACYEHSTMTDVLDAAHISWRYYTNSVTGILTAPNAINHMCQPAQVNGTTRCNGPDFTDGHIVANPPQILNDINNNDLQQVVWVNPPTASSDHPLSSNDSGPSWVASIVNTVGQSAYWNNTIILVTWDDWGGFYDHVAPPNDPARGYFEYGFRVPLVVISAFTPVAYVSNITHDFGSILRCIEKNFNLGLIPPGDYVDSRADDLSDFFNFKAAPRSFTVIPAPYPISYFVKLAADRQAHPDSIPPDADSEELLPNYGVPAEPPTP